MNAQKEPPGPVARCLSCHQHILIGMTSLSIIGLVAEMVEAYDMSAASIAALAGIIYAASGVSTLPLASVLIVGLAWIVFHLSLVR